MVERHPLDAIFRPRAVAVIGASRQRDTIGAEVFHNLLASGFPGPVYPINPTAKAVQSVRAFGSVLDIPDEVDLAVVAVPQRLVLRVVDECREKGVRGLVVLSAGFAETGAEGRAAQDALRRRVREAGIRMVGPNCLGVLNTEPAIRLNATFAPTWPPAGSVAIASQSGAVGLALLDYARHLGIGISQFASMGNKADISGNDLLEYWETDPNTRVILLYLESLGNATRFMQIAKRVSRKKPILVVKSGRTEAGARAATSHTGALAGMDIAADALFGQAGVVRTDTVEELFDLAVLLANQPIPAGGRLAILTNAGGPGIMASDAAESHGLDVVRLLPATIEALRAFLPAEASVVNPVDMLASASAECYEKAARLLVHDENVDAVLVLFVPAMVTEATAVAESIRRAGAGTTTPILTCLLGTHGIAAAVALLREGRFPSYPFPEAAVRALARATRYGRWLKQPEGTAPGLAGIDRERATDLVRKVEQEARERWLAPEETRALLHAYGFRTPEMQMAADLGAALAAAGHIGYPVALKLFSRTIVHKTEVGGVHLDLRGPADVERAYHAIERGLRERGLAESMEGVVVQEMVTGGVEMYVGMTEASGFGALLAFGAGGVSIEVFRDVAFRVHPVTDADAREMLEQIRAKKLLDGFRGAPVADKDALIEAILRVDRLVADFPEIQEMDINPLLALPMGQGVVAIDARIRIGTRRDRSPATPAHQAPPSESGLHGER